MNNITYAVSVDVNNPIIPYNVYVASVLDSNVRYLEITLYQNGNVIELSNTATATASLVTDNVLVNGSVNCTISHNIITVPLEDLQRHGNLDVQVTVTEGTKVLAIPFPIQVRVTPNIAEEAQVNENSMGSYAEVVQEIADARGDYISLSEALSHKFNYEIASNVDDCTQPNTIYKVRVNSGIVSASTMMALCVNSEGKLVQYAFARDGRILFRSQHTNEAWSAWDFIPTRALTYDMIHGAVSGYGAYQADESFSVHNTKVAEYLANPAYSASDYETSYVPASLSNNHYDQPASLSLTIPTGGSKITVFDTVTQTGMTKSVSGSTYQLTDLIPGRVYIYTIYNGSGKILASGTCKASGQVCMLNVGSNAYNVRDIGGWACDGGTLRYGLIYRGSELNKNVTLTAASIDLIKNSLGVRDEIDLRSDNDASGVTDTALGIGVNYIRIPIEYYQRILNTNYPERQQAIVNVMKRIAQNLRQNKPTYLHCQAGADRTAIICMLIEAVCGVSQSDLDRDLELSSFAYDVGGSRLTRKRSSGVSNEACWKNMMQAFAEMSGTGFSDKVIRYLISIGLSVEDVNSIRDNLISGAPAKIATPYADATVTKTLTNITIDNEATAVPMYQPYEANLRTESLYVISSFTLTMGGSDASSYYSNGRISIPRVTGNIVISATATQTNIISGNMLDTALNTRINAKANTTDVNTALEGRENLTNKVPNRAAMDNLSSETQYPSVKTMVQYTDDKALDVLGEVSDVKAYIGYTDDDILGLCADFENKRFTRLAGAADLSAGEDFDGFSMFGGRRRCAVSADGAINAFYGDAGYTEDGSNGQVMVYQPKFYYKVVPLKLEKQSNGTGFHLRKANYYVTATPHAGFKLHPLFYDANGNEVEYVLLSAYEGSLYDVSAGDYINDNAPGSYTYAQGDRLCSVAGKKPISGKLAGIGTKANFEAMAQAHSSGWHLDTIKSVSANQLLMLIELGQFNTQTAIGLGVVNNTTNGTYNCASLTGSTAGIGNETGMASATIFENGSGTTTNTVNGKLSVSYRGVENPWGNIFKHINGINLCGDGGANGGRVYIADDFRFNESVRGEMTISGTDYHYPFAGFTAASAPSAGGWISAFGYGDERYDWLFIPSAVNENDANNAVPVGDNYFTRSLDLNTFRATRFGGANNAGKNGGEFCWYCDLNVGAQTRDIGGRLMYVPTAAE